MSFVSPLRMFPFRRVVMDAALGTAGLLPYSIDFSTQSDGALPSPWSGTTWTVNSGAAINTLTPGADVVSNGNMEAGDPPTGWSPTGGATLSSVADERTGGSGAKSIQIVNVVGLGNAWQALGQPAGTWGRAGGWIKTITGGVSGRVGIYSSGLTIGIALNDDSGAWVERTMIYRLLAASRIFAGNVNVGVGNTVRADDLSFLPYTLSDMFTVLPKTVADVTVGIETSLAQGYTLGVVLNLDDASNPQNFVIGRIHWGAHPTNIDVILDKCVGGTYTTLVDTAAAYSAGAELRVAKSGTTYQISYNSVQIGGDQTISDAGIINNRIHGMFGEGGTGAGIDAFFCL